MCVCLKVSQVCVLLRSRAPRRKDTPFAKHSRTPKNISKAALPNAKLLTLGQDCLAVGLWGGVASGANGGEEERRLACSVGEERVMGTSEGD